MVFFFIGVFVGSQIMHSVDEPSMSMGIYHSNSLVVNRARDESAPQTALRGALSSLQQDTKPTPPVSSESSTAAAAGASVDATSVALLRHNREPKPVAASKPQVVDARAPIVKSGGVLISGGSSSSSAAAARADAGSVSMDSSETQESALKASLHITSEATSFRGPSDLDSSGVLMAAHIYLDDSPFDGDMRTVFSNKAPGCEVSPQGHGLSLFVNAWQTHDRQIYTEFGNDRSGCNKIGTTGLSIELTTWHHVAVLHTRTEVAIFLDGAVVASESLGDRLQPHEPQSDRPLIIGQFDGGAFPFYGNVSNVAVVKLEREDLELGDASSLAQKLLPVVRQLGSVADVRSTPGLAALMTLKEATVQAAGAKGLVHRPHGGGATSGLFTFPAPAGGYNSGPVTSISSGGLVNGLSGQPVTAEMITASEATGMQRREEVKEAMKHAWRFYRQYAWGYDELKPLSHRGHNNWGGMGVTLVDSLDTLWVMGMRTEFNEARDWVRDKLSFDNAGSVSVFETTIRELGGLLAAYDYSGDAAFLQKAEILGGRLAGAFSTGTGKNK